MYSFTMTSNTVFHANMFPSYHTDVQFHNDSNTVFHANMFPLIIQMYSFTMTVTVDLQIHNASNTVFHANIICFLLSYRPTVLQWQ